MQRNGWPCHGHCCISLRACSSWQGRLAAFLPLLPLLSPPLACSLLAWVQLSSLKEKEESSRQRAKTLERSTVALEKALVDAGRENERLQRAVRAQEAKAQEALERLRLAVDRAGSGSGGTVLAGVQEMEANLREAEGRLRVSDEKNNFLMRQLTSSREAEQRAKAAARAADTRYTKILQQVEDLARREAAARKAASSAAEKFRAVNAELVDLGCTQEGPAAVQEIRARLHDLGRQVSELKAREEAAEAATAEAMSRLAGVVRRLEKAEEKERELVRSERAATERSAELERRLSLLQQELVEARLAAGSAGQMVSQMSSQVEELRAREAQADEAIRRYEGLRGQVTDMEKRDAAYKGEIAAATERIAALSELISTLSRRETEMCSALEEANEKIEFLSERVGELVQREEVARAASESAEGKVVALSQKLGRLEQTQASAVEEAKSFKARLSISEERERQARQAADQANSRVQELFAKVPTPLSPHGPLLSASPPTSGPTCVASAHNQGWNLVSLPGPRVVAGGGSGGAGADGHLRGGAGIPAPGGGHPPDATSGHLPGGPPLARGHAVGRGQLQQQQSPGSARPSGAGRRGPAGGHRLRAVVGCFRL